MIVDTIAGYVGSSMYISIHLLYIEVGIIEFMSKIWRNYWSCHTWQGGQVELDLSPDTETEVQGSVPSSVSGLLSGLAAFGFP